ncbi:MAG: LLM class flavin-dependent oxidoreductase [Porticoccaceae bacterium]
MKVLAFEQLSYRHLPDDFTQKYNSVVDTPYHELVDRDLMHQDHVDFLDEMLYAARMGFDGIATTEHSQASYDVLPNPNLQMSALAYATEQEKLDVALAVLGRSLGKSREPIRIAEEYAAIDQISGGRLVAGFPVALSYDASQNAGHPPIETRPRYEDNRRLIERAWSAREPFEWNSQYNRYPNVNPWPRPYQERPPIWSPSIGTPSSLGRILDDDDVFLYLSWFGPKYTGARIFDRYWDLAVEKGKDANPYRLAFVQGVVVGETDEIAHKEYGPHVERGYQQGLGSVPLSGLGLPGYVDINGVEAMVKDPGDFGIVPKMKTISYSELVDAQCVIAGSPATVTEQLLEMVRRFRIGNLILMVQMGSMPKELVKKNIDMLSEHVLPVLQKEWQDEGWEHNWWPTGANKSANKSANKTEAGE